MLKERSNGKVDRSAKNKKFSMVCGASLIKVGNVMEEKRVKRDVKKDDDKGGDSKDQRKIIRRGCIAGFSRFSRRSLQRQIAKVLRAELPCFVTLTYPKEFSVTPKTWKRDLDVLYQRIKRSFPGFSAVWKLEPQQRQAPHYHLLIWGVSLDVLRDFIPQAWYEVVGSGDQRHLDWHMGKCGNGNVHCVQQVDSPTGLYKYAAKYVSKPVEGWNNVGKWWGTFMKKNLPVGDVLVFDMPENLYYDVLRYMRRFARLKSRSYPSLTIICDANHWYEKLTTKPMGSYAEWLEKLRVSGL